MSDRLTIDNVLERITMLLKEKGWSVYRLADECGIPRSSLYTMMKKRTMPKLDTLDIICDALGITLSDFFITRSNANGYLSSKESLLLEILRPIPDKYLELVTVYAKGLSDAYSVGNSDVLQISLKNVPLAEDPKDSDN